MKQTQVVSVPAKKEPPPPIPGKNPMKGMVLGVELREAISDFRGMPREKVIQVYHRVVDACKTNSRVSKEDLRLFVALHILENNYLPESIQRVVVWEKHIEIMRRPGIKVVR